MPPQPIRTTNRPIDAIPLGVVAKERHPEGVSCVLPLRAQSTILVSQSALDLVRRDGD